MRRSSFSNRIAVVIVAVLLAAQLSASTHNPRDIAEVRTPEPTTNARATVSPHGVLVEWNSEFDNRILGFNVFRIGRAQRFKLNPGLIAGPTMIFGGRAPGFAWFDPAGASDCTYEVESVDLHGESLLRTIAAVDQAATLPAYRQTALLADLGKGKSTQTSNREWRDALKTDRSSEIVAGDTSATLGQQWSIAGQPALKIGIRSDGWYRITQPQLSAAGFDVTGEARNLQLIVEGNEIAMSVSRDAGALAQADFIEFWGEGLDRPTTDTRVYWLVNGQQPGRRISILGNLRPDVTPAAPGVIPDLSPAVSPSLTQFVAVGSWPIPETSLHGTSTARNNETVAVLRASSGGEALPELERNTVESQPVKTIAGESVPEQSLSKERTPRPVPSAESNAIVPQAKLAAAKRARSLNPMKSRARPRRKSSHNHRRRPRAHLHNHALDAGSAVPAFTYSTEYSVHNIYY